MKKLIWVLLVFTVLSPAIEAKADSKVKVTCSGTNFSNDDFFSLDGNDLYLDENEIIPRNDANKSVTKGLVTYSIKPIAAQLASDGNGVEMVLLELGVSVKGGGSYIFNAELTAPYGHADLQIAPSVNLASGQRVEAISFSCRMRK